MTCNVMCVVYPLHFWLFIDNYNTLSSKSMCFSTQWSSSVSPPYLWQHSPSPPCWLSSTISLKYVWMLSRWSAWSGGLFQGRPTTSVSCVSVERFLCRVGCYLNRFHNTLWCVCVSVRDTTVSCVTVLSPAYRCVDEGAGGDWRVSSDC